MTSKSIYTIDNLRNRRLFFKKVVTVRIFMYCNAENYLETFYGRLCSLAEDCEGHLVSEETGTLVDVSYEPLVDTAELFLRQGDGSVRAVKVPYLENATWESSRAYRVMQFDVWTSIFC